MSRNLWFVLAPVAGAATALAGAAAWQVGAALGAVAAIAVVAGVHRYRPSRRWIWVLLGAAIVSLQAPTLLEALPSSIRHTGATAEVIAWSSLAAPMLLIGATLTIVRIRCDGSDRAGAIDAFTVAVGVGTVAWVALLEPSMTAPRIPLDERALALTSQLFDLCMVGVAVRLAITPRPRTAALWALVAALASVAIAHSAAMIVATTMASFGDRAEQLTAFGAATGAVLIGLAAMHPSMKSLTEPATDDRVLGSLRLVLLAAASLIAPSMIALQVLPGSGDRGIGVLVDATIVLFLLVVARMWGLARAQERSAAYEMALRGAGAKLATATNQDGIHRAAIDAISALAGTDAAVRMCDSPQRPERFVVMASSGALDASGSRFSLSLFPEWKRDLLRANEAFVARTYESTLVSDLFLVRREEGSVFTAPLFVLGELRGLMVVATPEEMDRSLVDSLTALSTQVALALESAALTRNLLRQQSEARFASLVSNSSDVVCVVDHDTVISYISPAVARVLGYDPQRLEGTRFSDLVHPDDAGRTVQGMEAHHENGHDSMIVELRVRHARGEYVATETLFSYQADDPNVGGTVLNVRDVTERKRFEQQLEHQAFHDSVTSLANRALFRDRVTHAIDRHARDHEPISVLFMDLDDFKTINDSLGHAAGDQLLAEVGGRLRRCLRAADTAARLGGDEFAILLEDGDDGVQAVDVADRIMQMFEEPFALEGKEVFVRASVGIATIDGEHGGGVEELLRNADVAMYMAKERGKGTYQVFEPAMHDTALKRLELKADLQRAIEYEEYRLHYQPVIELETGRIAGVEALVRWIHPVRGLVPPLEFIPLAEETGLIVEIGRWVLREACRTAVELQRDFPAEPPLHMAVNLSARQVSRPEIVGEVREILAATGLEPGSLILEITESVMMHDLELSIERLGQLKSLGVRLAVDDFGTGYSSLNYIRRFPVDILKVDKSFVDGVIGDGEDPALTEAVIKLAGILHLTPVAEGIERADQLQRLLELRCDLGQGYFFSEPLPVEELTSLLHERRAMHGEAEALARGRLV
ncbi:MAG TPA: EAL domain-containing protein [Actinomycetota bacterium]|nr:EAL domain-containing protein [Actinomycetota bacterium]